MPVDYNRKPIVDGRIKRLIDRYRIIMATDRTVANICRQKHISRKTYYRRIDNYAQDGVLGLLDKQRNSSQKEILQGEIRSIVHSDPKLGCRKISDRLKQSGIKRSHTAIYNILSQEGLSTPEERIRYCHMRDRESEMYQ